MDAKTILAEDHIALLAMAEQIREAPEHHRDALVGRLSRALRIHSMLEGEIFYPALRNEVGIVDELDQAHQEHAAAEAAVSELEAMPPGDAEFLPCTERLTAALRLHFDEEERVLFLDATRSPLDLQAMGVELDARRQVLLTVPDALEPGAAG